MPRPTTLGLLAAALLSCKRDPWPHSADAALDALRSVAETGDAAGLFYALDERTRWSVASLRRDHAEAIRLIRADYPAAAQAQELARFVEAPDEPIFLARLAERRGLVADLKRRTPAAPEITCDQWKRCGWDGLRAPLGELVEATTHHLATVRDSAAAYRQAGGGP